MLSTGIFFFLLGLIIGSFLNVVILRHNTGKTLAGRSGCFSCGKTLRWHELIPVLSFLWQKGKCRGCQSKISWQYPLVELGTGILFALSVWKFYPNWLAVAFYLVISCLLVIITVYDLRHKIIPEIYVYTFIILSLLRPVILGTLTLTVFWAIFLSGLAIFLFFAALWLFSAGRAMGFGDAKLGFGIGALLGLHDAVSAVMLAFWIGAAFGIILLLLAHSRKIFKTKFHFTFKSEIPFAPFLVLGLLLVLFGGLNVLGF